jgi:hypothetical protein
VEIIHIQSWFKDVPLGFTGIVIWPDGDKSWLKNGDYCRYDGPAMKWKDSERWFLDGEQFSFEQFWERMKDTKYAPKIMAYVLGARTDNGKAMRDM